MGGVDVADIERRLLAKFGSWYDSLDLLRDRSTPVTVGDFDIVRAEYIGTDTPTPRDCVAVLFTAHDRRTGDVVYFRKTNTYDSFFGVTWDGPFEQVTPTVVATIIWEPIS
ncbi:hypothetical protein AB0E01_22815 [Nocardia vinacea]|uniref:hypothetical protein n=1 Tax=Nocardia vinacea TaxID=96468 RepID=UPI0033D6013D